MFIQMRPKSIGVVQEMMRRRIVAKRVRYAYSLNGFSTNTTAYETGYRSLRNMADLEGLSPDRAVMSMALSAGVTRARRGNSVHDRDGETTITRLSMLRRTHTGLRACRKKSE